MTVIKTLARWKVEDAPVGALRAILGKRTGFAHWVPTERVLRCPGEPVVMRSARMATVYAKEVRELTGLTHAQWPDLLPGNNGHYRGANYALIVEVYCDRGDDGHTDFALCELVLIPAASAEALKLGDPSVVCPLHDLYSGEYVYYEGT